MTLLPAEDWTSVTPESGRPAYQHNSQCAVPGCWEPATSGHHLWRRSFIGAPVHWVLLDGKLVGNVAGLCTPHHDDVTGRLGGHRAWIRWLDGAYYWWVADPRGTVSAHAQTWKQVGALDPMPPIQGYEPEEHDHQLEVCPACGQKQRAPKKETLEPGTPRPKSKFVITVPVDERENGWDVLRTLIDEWKKETHRDHEKGDYVPVVELCVFGLQHAHRLREEGA